MRAIDVDSAISLIQEDKIEGKTLDIMKALGDGLQAETLNLTCDRHIKIISSLPTLDAMPVKHGHWIGDKCSACGEERAWYGCNPHWCPDCGAKMDEEGNE